MKKKGLGIRDWGLGSIPCRRVPLLVRKQCGLSRSDDLVQPLAASQCCSSRFSNPQSLIPNPPRAFTLVEMLVTVAIIGIMAGLVFGALSAAREAARDAATKATIAKLNTILMRRYESYMTRRVSIQIPPTATPAEAAKLRLNALRVLMLMEMPDARDDIVTFCSAGSMSLTVGTNTATLQEPALHRLFRASPPSSTFDSAQCLYKVVSMGSPEAMEQFNSSELGVVEDASGNKYPVFIDAWGTPICWLRWAPGFSSPNSDIQTGSASTDPDPFDPRRVDVDASSLPRDFHMIPLIVSAGPNKKFGIQDLDNNNNARASAVGDYLLGRMQCASNNGCLDIYGTAVPPVLGAPNTAAGFAGTHHDNITNHHIEQR